MKRLAWWGLAAAILWATTGFAGEPWMSRWTVVADGQQGEMHLVIEATGRTTGTVIGLPAEGFVAGDHLVLNRRTETGVEIWNGLRGRTGPGGSVFLAGTVERGGVATPWYATSSPADVTADGAVAAPQELAETGPKVDAPAVAATGVAEDEQPIEVVAPADPSRIDQRAGEASPVSLAGTWETPAGVIVVQQDGRRLEVVDALGTPRSGRMTGPTTFVIGLRPACCRGELAGLDLIKWEDGTFWKRARSD